MSGFSTGTRLRSSHYSGLMAAIVLFTGCATSPGIEPLNRVIQAGSAGSSVVITQSQPVGSVVPYAGAVNAETRSALASQGWLLCDGSQVSRSDFPLLFGVIGTLHGQGDGRLSFHLPDYRGRFLRGVSADSGRDRQADSRQAAATGGNSGNAVGSVQDESIGLHQHADVGLMQEDSIAKVIGTVDPRPGMVQTQNAAVPGDADRETRPVNVYVQFLIFAGADELVPQP